MSDQQLCELMNIKPNLSSNNFVITNFGYGFCIDQSSPAGANSDKFPSTSNAGSSGFVSGISTPSSSCEPSENPPQLIDLFKKRPFDHLIDEDDEEADEESSDAFDNEFSRSNESMAPSEFAQTGSWCFSDYGELHHHFDESLKLNMADLESGLAELSFDSVDSRRDDFQPDRASTPNLGELAAESGNNCMPPPPPKAANKLQAPTSCEYCASIGAHPLVIASHTMKDKKDRVLCPKLRQLECIICKADGDIAHIVDECPNLMLDGSF